MSKPWAELDVNEIVITVLDADDDLIATFPGTWVPRPWDVAVGWDYNGGTWVGPQGQPSTGELYRPDPSAGVQVTYILPGAVWVDRFTDDEWAWLKAQRVLNTSEGKKLDKLMDAVRWTDSINVAVGSNSDPFYQWLLDNNIPGGQTRIDELREPL